MFIKWLKFIFLGIIQGITEPIPVSSSGHILIFKQIIEKASDNINFELLATITNFGSLIAILILFKNDIIYIANDFFKYCSSKNKKYYDNFKYALYIIVATIPAGICGIIITKLNIFEKLETNIKFVGITLLITSLFLFLIRNIKGSKEKKDIDIKDAITIGLFQVVALIPGISRSGATIVGGMKQNLSRKTAFQFSFLLYIPISIATTILGIKDLFTSNLSISLWICYISSMIFAAIFTYYATKIFKKIVEEGKLIYFSFYCLLLGIIILIG